jgi:polysaccharide biosynthesis protein PslH
LNILLLSYEYPNTFAHGSYLIILNIAKELKNKNICLHLLYVKDCEQQNMDEYFTSVIHLKYEKTFIQKIISNIFFFFPSIQKFTDFDILNILKEKKINLVWSFSDILSMAYVSKHYGNPLVSSLVDSRGMFYKRELEKNKQVNIYFKYFKYYFLEKYIIDNSNCSIFVSQKDADFIKINHKIKVIPNGVDTEYFKSTKVQKSAEPNYLFFGNMDFAPNIYTAKYLANEIFPKLKEKLPAARLFLVGKNPTYEVKELGRRDGIIVTGIVDDMRVYIDNSIMVLAPMFIGGGIKNKILEACAMEKMVLTNTIGSEALVNEFKEEIIIRDSDIDFTNEAVKYFHKKDYKKTILNDIVQKHYSWEFVASEYIKIFEELLCVE